MILTKHTTLIQETHVVIPVSLGKQISVVQLDLAEGKEEIHFMLYAIPNQMNKYSAWEYVPVTNLKAFPFRCIERIFKAHTKLVDVQTHILNIYASFTEFLLYFPWEHIVEMENLIEFLKTHYGQNYTFVSVQLNKPGRYQFGWTWASEYPFIAARGFHKPMHSLLAIVLDSHHLDWTTNDSLIQYVCTDVNILHTIYKFIPRELQIHTYSCFVGAYIDPHLYSGDIKTHVIHTLKNHKQCALM